MIAGARPFNLMYPPAYVSLPSFSKAFIERFGSVRLESVLSLDGTYCLNPMYRGEAELAIAEVPASGRRKHYVTRIQLKGEAWES